MPSKLPFPPVAQLIDAFGTAPQPPQWLVREVHQRLILLLNHVLQQEPVAMARIARHCGQVVLLQWRGFSLGVMGSAAGLLELAAPGKVADLSLTVTDESPLGLLRAALRGDKPAVRIEGDVQLAAEVNWLVDSVRWDLEQDLARLLGDAPAHTLAQAINRVTAALRQFLQKPGASGKAAA